MKPEDVTFNQVEREAIMGAWLSFPPTDPNPYRAMQQHEAHIMKMAREIYAKGYNEGVADQTLSTIDNQKYGDITG